MSVGAWSAPLHERYPASPVFSTSCCSMEILKEGAIDSDPTHTGSIRMSCTLTGSSPPPCRNAELLEIYQAKCDTEISNPKSPNSNRICYGSIHTVSKLSGHLHPGGMEPKESNACLMCVSWFCSTQASKILESQVWQLCTPLHLMLSAFMVPISRL